jgi:S1-C subfamily serine protease
MIKLHKLILAGTLLINTHGVANSTLHSDNKVNSVMLQQHDPIQNSIVKIFTVANESDFDEPWASHVKRFSGSGCIIDGEQILTNAHVVTSATYIEVLKNGETKRYEAEVLSISHESDLALITIKDKSFFKKTKSLEIGKLPKMQQEVNVYGFPMGGETLSITKGVVSRIEHQNYVHSNKSLLAIQIDAAINAGNSGGPAISNEKIVGLVMQGNTYAENMGYIIPPSVINHYLDDMRDNLKYDGYPFLGITTQDIENPTMKEMYGLKNNRYGILINEIIPNSAVDGVLKRGDILMAIDGKKIFSNQKIELRKNEFVDYIYMLNQHQIGETIELTIRRGKKEQKARVKLKKKSEELTLVKRENPDTTPRYFIYGGLIFVPGIREYYRDIPSKYYSIYPNKEREELVILKDVLSSSLTKGYSDSLIDIVDSINGKKFKNFEEFVSLLENATDKFIVLEDEEHFQIVLNRADVVAKQDEILIRYNIKSYLCLSK